MNRFLIFFIRAFLGAALAVIFMRFFYRSASPILVAGLAIFMVGMAYVTEHFRNRKTKK